VNLLGDYIGALIPATAKEFLDDINRDLTENPTFLNNKGRVAVMTTLRMLFSDETIFANLGKFYSISFVSSVDKNLDILLSKNMKKYGTTFAAKNLLLTIIDGKLIAFLSRAVGGTESKAWYARGATPMAPPQVK
jgi:hypothetical protein